MQICSPPRTTIVLPSVTSVQILLKVIRVEDPLHFSEDLKHLALDQILFAKENCPSFVFLGNFFGFVTDFLPSHLNPLNAGLHILLNQWTKSGQKWQIRPYTKNLSYSHYYKNAPIASWLMLYNLFFQGCNLVFEISNHILYLKIPLMYSQIQWDSKVYQSIELITKIRVCWHCGNAL